MVLSESAPSKLHMREPYLSADSTGYENGHIDDVPLDLEKIEDDDDMSLAPHLRDELDSLKSQTYGPVPPKGIDPHAYPDMFTRGQYDNVTWSR